MTTSPSTLNPDHLPGSDAITRSSKSNLALSFLSLPPERREAMTIFYAFCRVVDDVSDSETLSSEEKRHLLSRWREEIRAAYAPNFAPKTELGKEMAVIVNKYQVPLPPLEEIINGVEMDLVKSRYATFAELELYCYRVASAVGLVSIRLFGCTDPATETYAIALGMAFQLTNILRDVKKDLTIDRIYLPQHEMAQFGVTDSDLQAGRFTETMRQLMRFQGQRARHYFAKAHRLMVPGDRPFLLAAEVMREVYEEILLEIERRNFDNFSRPIKFGKIRKLYLFQRGKRREKRAELRPPPPKRVVVLGGGYAGLAAAAELVGQGHQVTLLESRALLGGRAHSFVDASTGQVLDNGQHIFMGCYHETLDLLRALGVEQRLVSPSELAVPFRSSKGSSVLRAVWPEPFHLLSALLGFRELDAAAKWSAIRLALRLRLGEQPALKETVAEWLSRWRQPEKLIRALWEPLCLAALNEPCASADAALFATVIRRSFLGSAHDAKIFLSRVGLSELFAPEIARLMPMCGSVIRQQTPVTALHFETERLHEIELSSGERIRPEVVISALPWHVLRSLLPKSAPLTEICRGLQDAPIISLHLWLDRPVLLEAFVGLLDSPVHWLFQREKIHAQETSAKGHVLTAVISGAREWLDCSAAQLEAMTLREVTRFFPEAQGVQVFHRVIYKARSATFAATPEAEALRPGAATPWKNFWLAGDWTQTGLPATLEGAVLSGRRAARAVDAAVLA